MTLNQLYKRLGRLIGEGHGRQQVCIAKRTFEHNCEDDGVTILPVEGLGVDWINIADGDGGTGVNKDGSERMRETVILAGGSGVNSKGQLIDEYRNC